MIHNNLIVSAHSEIQRFRFVGVLSVLWRCLSVSRRLMASGSDLTVGTGQFEAGVTFLQL